MQGNLRRGGTIVNPPCAGGGRGREVYVGQVWRHRKGRLSMDGVTVDVSSGRWLDCALADQRPIIGFAETWQLVTNTSTTIVTFLMVFPIQNTLNRDTAAIQSKLDELIRATQGAHNALMDMEEMEEAQLEQFRHRYEAMAQDARQRVEQGQPGTDTREA